MLTHDFYQQIDRGTMWQCLKQLPTPCYAYFGDIIKERFRALQIRLPPNFKIFYALKANPNPDIVRLLAHLGAGADCASAGEIRTALANGIPPELIEFTGPGKKTEELAYAVECGISAINVESLGELDTLLHICRDMGRRARVGARLNPGQPKGKQGISMSGATQFGLSPADIHIVLSKITLSPDHLDFAGFHVHAGSQVLSAETVVDNHRAILELIRKIVSNSDIKPRKINFGGGLGIRYFPNQPFLDLEELSKGLKSLHEEICYKELLSDTTLIIEPGRFLVGESGIYLTKVLYVKEIEQTHFAVVDGGMHQNYLLVGGMGQVIRRNFQMDVLGPSRVEGDQKYTYNIAGCLCTPQDLLATDFRCSEKLAPGDLLIFFNSGAYGPTASPLGFLGHTPPREFLLDGIWRTS